MDTLVLCYKCFEEKHGECMGKAGLFDCDCKPCKQQVESKIN